MSPEQERGKTADARSGVFSLGVILYEMLSGQRALEKDSSADIMAAILKEKPLELSGDGKKIPPAVDRIVRHCLEKNPAESFQSAHDLAFNLEALSTATSGDRGRAIIIDLRGKRISSSSAFPSVERLAWARWASEVWFGATVNHAWANAIHAVALNGKERIVRRLPGMMRLENVSSGGRVLLTKDVWYTGMQFHGVNDDAERDVLWLDAAVLSDISPDAQYLAFGEYGEAAGRSRGCFVAEV